MKCEICGGNNILSKDHCHITGDDRGMLCRGHNIGLGYFGHSPELLRAAADYLERYPSSTNTWVEKCFKTLDMHDKGLTHRAIARITGYSSASVHRTLKLAEAVKLFPELTSESTDYDAWKTYKEIENTLMRGAS